MDLSLLSVAMAASLRNIDEYGNLNNNSFIAINKLKKQSKHADVESIYKHLRKTATFQDISKETLV